MLQTGSKPPASQEKRAGYRSADPGLLRDVPRGAKGLAAYDVLNSLRTTLSTNELSRGFVM